MAALRVLHRSISHRVLDDVEYVMQAQKTPMEVPFTPTLPKIPEAYAITETDSHRSEPYTTTEPDSPIAPTEVDCDN